MKILRPALLAVLGLLLLAAIRGGVALFSLPDEQAIRWLGSDATRIFALPAIVLFAIGGASLVALLTLIARPARVSMVAAVPGLILAGSVAADAMVLGPRSLVPPPIAATYLAIGGAVVALAIVLGKRSADPRRPATRRIA